MLYTFTPPEHGSAFALIGLVILTIVYLVWAFGSATRGSKVSQKTDDDRDLELEEISGEITEKIMRAKRLQNEQDNLLRKFDLPMSKEEAVATLKRVAALEREIDSLAEEIEKDLLDLSEGGKNE